MKTINIYLTTTEKDQATRLMRKYKVSLSTLTGKICFYMTYALTHHGIENNLLDQLQEKYLETGLNHKTSVKPKELMEVLANTITNKSMFATNCLKIYLNKLVENYILQEGKNEFYTNLDKALTECKDMYWNYNVSIRSTRRMIKQNKKYWKRVLEE